MYTLTVCPSVRLSRYVISTETDLYDDAVFIERWSRKFSFRQCRDVAEIRMVSPSYSETIFYKYPCHAKLGKRATPSSASHLLSVPRHNLSFGARAFRVSAPPKHGTRYLFTSANPKHILLFRRRLKTHYIHSVYRATWPPP